MHDEPRVRIFGLVKTNKKLASRSAHVCSMKASPPNGANDQKVRNEREKLSRVTRLVKAIDDVGPMAHMRSDSGRAVKQTSVR